MRQNVSRQWRRTHLNTDEMMIKAMEKYDKYLQKFVDAVDLGGVTSHESSGLSNKMLGCLLNGLKKPV